MVGNLISRVESCIFENPLTALPAQTTTTFTPRSSDVLSVPIVAAPNEQAYYVPQSDSEYLSFKGDERRYYFCPLYCNFGSVG